MIIPIRAYFRRVGWSADYLPFDDIDDIRISINASQ